MSSSQTTFNRHHPGVDQDMSDELEKDEIVEGSFFDQEAWRAHVSPIMNAKRKRDSNNSDEDHSLQQNNKTKRRSTADKHKAPPLSCEAVKRLFTGITKVVLSQRLDEAKALIASIKEGYSNVSPPQSNNNNNINSSSSSSSNNNDNNDNNINNSNSSSFISSPRLNLLCHLLQSPPTSRIDGISSKVFSNLELYKLFTTYNNYKEELAQSSHTNPHLSSNNHKDSLNPLGKKNSNHHHHHQHILNNSDPLSSPITFPTYSSFIDPTVTLHIKEKTGGKEVGKHRLNCAWRLSILCELLGKGVLLMTKELSGAKLERILVEEFSKLVDFLRNPDNRDWVASIREKMDLPGFDDVYKPLDDADLESNQSAVATTTSANIAPQIKSNNTLSSPSSSSTATITSTANLTSGENSENIHHHGSLDIDSNNFSNEIDGDQSEIPNILTFTIDSHNNNDIMQQQEKKEGTATTTTATTTTTTATTTTDTATTI